MATLPSKMSSPILGLRARSRIGGERTRTSRTSKLFCLGVLSFSFLSFFERAKGFGKRRLCVAKRGCPKVLGFGFSFSGFKLGVIVVYPLRSPKEDTLTITELGKYVTFAAHTVGQKNILGYYNKNGKIIPYKENEICELLEQSNKTAIKFFRKLMSFGMIVFDGTKYNIPYDFCKMCNGYGIRQTVNALRGTL